MWTAGTTAAAFFALNVSSLPGLAQLGNLVGVGVIVGAVVMLTVFAPLVLRRQQREGEHRAPSAVERWVVSPRFYRAGAWVTLVLVVVLLGGLAWKGFPGTDFSAKPLRPRHSEADEAMDQLTRRLMGSEGEPLSLVVRGPSVEAVRQRLRDAETQLAAAQKRGDVRSFRTALVLWPDESNQRANLPVLAPLANDAPRLRKAMLDAGFKDDAFALTDAVLKQWAAWSTRPPPIWPDNAASRWILRRLAKHSEGQWFALGVVQPTPGHEAALDGAVSGEGIELTGWHLLTYELQQVVPREFVHAIIGIVLAVVGLLAFAFREVRSVVVFVATTALVFLCLMGAMSLLGMHWNFFNLAALLLLLGTGTDYSILLAVGVAAQRRRRVGGPARTGAGRGVVREFGVGGFGTISWANHLGLASLGQTCALGLLIDAAISIFLLPPAWAWLHRRTMESVNRSPHCPIGQPGRLLQADAVLTSGWQMSLPRPQTARLEKTFSAVRPYRECVVAPHAMQATIVSKCDWMALQ